MTIIWCMVPRYEARQTEFFLILSHFLPFYPHNNLKNEKMPGDIIILHKCTKNHDHMLYCSWDMPHDGCNCYFSFWTIFLLFYPLPNSPKNQTLKTMKKTPGDIIILHKCTKNHDHMLYCSWDMVHGRWMDGRMDGQKKWDRRTDRKSET